MIVDDNKDVLYSLKTLLEKKNYEVITVDDGVKCIKKLEQGFKGVVLMDLMMPGMDGVQTIKEIVKKGLNKDVVIEIITGYGSDNDKKIAKIAPYIFDYLSKPLDPVEILESIKKCSVSISS